MSVAFIFSLYLRDLKILIENSITDSVMNTEKSLVRRIFIVRWVVNVYSTYKKAGVLSVIKKTFEYLVSFITDNYSK